MCVLRLHVEKCLRVLVVKKLMGNKGLPYKK